jgi:beta-galactosidase beta subunit
MILDDLSELNKYVAVHPRFAAAFDYILNTKFDNMPVGKKEIDGKNILAIISDEDAVPMMES